MRHDQDFAQSSVAVASALAGGSGGGGGFAQPAGATTDGSASPIAVIRFLERDLYRRLAATLTGHSFGGLYPRSWASLREDSRLSEPSG